MGENRKDIKKEIAAQLNKPSPDPMQNVRARRAEENKKKDDAAKILKDKDVQRSYKRKLARAKGLKGFATNALRTIVHFFPDKNRTPQIAFLEALLKEAQEGNVAPEVMYAGLVYMQDEIGKTKVKSRLKSNVIMTFCEELQKRDPSLKGMEPKDMDMHVKKFKVYVNQHPSKFPMSNPVAAKIRKPFQVERVAAEVAKKGTLVTNTRMEKAGAMIAQHTIDRWMLGPEKAMNTKYQANRRLASKMYQHPSRVTMTKELNEVMDRIARKETDKPTEVLIGCLLDIKMRIEAEKPKDQKHFAKSAMGKVVGGMLDELDIPENLARIDVEAMRNFYQEFSGKFKLEDKHYKKTETLLMTHDLENHVGQKKDGQYKETQKRYNDKRGMVSKFFQKKTRPAMAKELDDILTKLQGDGKLTAQKKTEVLVGCLLDIKATIEAEKPNSRDHFAKSAMGKEILATLKEIGVSEHTPDIGDKFKNAYREYVRRPDKPPTPPARRI